MALKVQPGSSVTFIISAQDPDTLSAIAGLPVFLDVQEQTAGPPRQVAGGQTDGSGQVQLSTTLPGAPGTYTFRARTPGVAEKFRADVSKNVPIEVVAV